MVDEQQENIFASTYIKRLESILFEHLRKQVEAETKSVLFEMAVNQQNKQIEEMNNTIQGLQNTIEQSLNGVKAATLDRQASENALANLQNQNNDMHQRILSLKQEVHEQKSISGQFEKQVQDLNEKLSVSELNYATTKNNYLTVVKALEQSEKKAADLQIELEQCQAKNNKVKTNKAKKQDSEWVDGD